MSFEEHARTQLGYQSDYELQRFTNNFGINDPALASSPLSEGHLQELAEEELALREEERIAAAVRQEELDEDLIDDL